MPELTNPGFLLLIPAVPFLVRWWLRRHRGALGYPDTRLFKELPAGRAHSARWAGAAVRAGALMALIIALCGPRWPDLRTRVTTEGIAIAMVVDCSGSMAEKDFHWNETMISRLDAVKKAFGLFVMGGKGLGGELLEGRTNDLICLIAFATRPETVCPLTLSHSVLVGMLDAEKPRSLPTESETNIGDAIAWGLHRLESTGSRRKIMVLLSDGEHNVPPPALKPRQAAQIAAGLHVPIYTILAGAKPPADDGSMGFGESAADRANGEETLQAVAQITGGRFFRADDSKNLLAVCNEIDRQERQEIRSFQYRRYYEGYPWFALAAFVLLTTVHMLERSLWQTVP